MQVSEQQSLGVAKEQHDTAAVHLKQATAEADARLAQVCLLLNPYHAAAALCMCVSVSALKARLTALCICTTTTQAALLHLN